MDSSSSTLNRFLDPSSNSNPEYFIIRHASFDWTIDFANKSIYGTVSYDMAPVDTDFSPDERIVLDVKDIEISKVLSNKVEASWSVDVGSHPSLGSSLIILTPQQKSSFTLEIQFRTQQQSSALQWLDIEMTADKVRPFLFTQCQAIHARSLFPCQDTPSVKFTYTAIIRAPVGATVLMGAMPSLVPESLHINEMCTVHMFSQTIPIPSYLVALACGELKSISVGSRSKVWAEPSIVEKAGSEFAEVESIISAAESICGPYEWGIYDILVLPPSFPYGGMENPCLTFVTPCLLAGDRSLVSVIAHEVSHSWTGNLVTNSSWEHFWLNEGHTTYLEGLILEVLHGSDYRELHIELGYEELQKCLSEMKNENPLTMMVPSLKGVHPDTSFSIIPYEKGSLLLYFLEEKYGKEKILSWLRSYISRFRCCALTTDMWIDFLASELGVDICKEINLNGWLYATGPIPWKLSFKRKLSTICDEVVERIASKELGCDAVTAESIRAIYEQLIPLQKQLVLQRLLDRLPLHHNNLRVLDSMFAFSQSLNAEIRFRWSLICLHSQYLPGLDSALEFLNGQGRMKYTRPIYRALMSWPAIKQQSINNFKLHRPTMHPTTAKLVEKDIGLA